MSSRTKKEGPIHWLSTHKYETFVVSSIVIVIGAIAIDAIEKGSQSSEPGSQIVNSIKSGHTKVTATPHIIVLSPGDRVRSTPIEVSSSEPDNTVTTVQKGKLGLLKGVGQLTEDGQTWWVGSRYNQLVFVNQSDLAQKEANTGHTFYKEFAPSSLDYQKTAIVNDGILRQPGNNDVVGEYVEVPEHNLADQTQGYKRIS